MPVAATNNTANPTTTLDLFYGPGGGTLTWDTGLSINSLGLTGFAPGQTQSATSGMVVAAGGDNGGLYVSSPDQIATYSIATSETGVAVYANAAVEAGIGVHAVGGQYGVLAASTDDMSTAGYFSGPLSESSEGTGVYAEGYIRNFGQIALATGGDAGFFDGNVTVIGNLFKSGGSFKIDDPIDPSRKVFVCIRSWNRRT